MPDFIFTKDCNRHDFDYWIGGGVLARLKADVKFLARMLLRACEQADGWAEFFHWLGVAVMYFVAVRRFGWGAFRYGTPRTVDDLPEPDEKPRVQT